MAIFIVSSECNNKFTTYIYLEVNPFEAADIPVCDDIFDSFDNVNLDIVPRKHFF